MQRHGQGVRQFSRKTGEGAAHRSSLCRRAGARGRGVPGPAGAVPVSHFHRLDPDHESVNDPVGGPGPVGGRVLIVRQNLSQALADGGRQRLHQRLLAVAEERSPVREELRGVLLDEDHRLAVEDGGLRGLEAKDGARREEDVARLERRAGHGAEGFDLPLRDGRQAAHGDLPCRSIVVLCRQWASTRRLFRHSPDIPCVLPAQKGPMTVAVCPQRLAAQQTLGTGEA